MNSKLFDTVIQLAQLTEHKNLRELVNGKLFGALAPSLTFGTRLHVMGEEEEKKCKNPNSCSNNERNVCKCESNVFSHVSVPYRLFISVEYFFFAKKI